MAESYSSKDINILEGLEPVRKRPAMYIGSTSSAGLHHLIWEILDNSIDEAINGHCDTIEISIDNGDEVTIKDNGRGVPVDTFRGTKKSAMEVLFTTLHSGGKFGQGNYKVSGGLHGVGMAVVCALSESLTATSCREGFEWTQTYSKGKPTSKIKKGKASRKNGTTITFKPDKEIFPKAQLSIKSILERTESKAFLNKGLKLIIKENGSTHTFQYHEGLKDFIRKI
jgi:DNA gyrase/topoisomerase IV subunit B